MTGRPTTSGASNFPPTNLPQSAQAWGRAVMQRVAQLEEQNGRQDGRILDLNHTLVGALHSPQDGTFSFKGDWVAPTPGYPVNTPLEFPSLVAGALPSNFTASSGWEVGTDTAGGRVSPPDSGNAIEFPTVADPSGTGAAGPGFVEWTLAEPLPADGSTYFARFAWAYRPGVGTEALRLLANGVQVWASPAGVAQLGWPVVLPGVPAGTTVLRWEHDSGGNSAIDYAWIESLGLYKQTLSPPTGGAEYVGNDLVRHDGRIWIANDGTAITDEPSTTSTAWTLFADAGQGSGVNSDVYRAAGIQAGGSAGSGGGYFGIENHGYEANQHTGMYLFEGYLDFIASNDADGSNTEAIQDNQSYSLYATDPSGVGYPLLELGLDAHTHVPYARILGVAAGGTPGEQHDFASAGQWTVNHSIGRIPSVTVYDAGGNLLLAEVAATSTQVVITFANPTAGTVVLT